MIADFHNDYLVSEHYANIIKEYAQSSNLIVSALFRGRRDLIFARYLSAVFAAAKEKYNAQNLFLAFEDFGYECDISLLCHALLDKMPCYVGLTWNGENNLAFGCGSDGHLKLRGKKIIKELNRRKIAVDLAHLSKKSFYDAIEIADFVACSHTCFYEMHNHMRNLDYEQLRLIVERGGLVGLTLYTPFLTDKKVSTIDDVYRHLDYFVERFGTNNLAIGTDFYGCDLLPVGFDDYSFEYLLRDFLLSKGYKNEDINRILFANLNAFLNGGKK